VYTVDKLFKTDISLPILTTEVSILIGCVLHLKRVARLVTRVGRHIVASVTLVHIHTTSVALLEKSLLRVHVRVALDPRSRVDRMAVVLALQIDPVDNKRNTIFTVASHDIGADSLAGLGHYRHRHGQPPQRPHMKVYVMRIQILTYVRRLSSPRLEGF